MRYLRKVVAVALEPRRVVQVAKSWPRPIFSFPGEGGVLPMNEHVLDGIYAETHRDFKYFFSLYMFNVTSHVGRRDFNREFARHRAEADKSVVHAAVTPTLNSQ